MRAPELIDIERELYKRSLSDYIKAAWHVVEPGTQYLTNWHIEIIAEYLQAATRGEIRNLIVNIPPRCMKSTLISVMFPTWVWTFAPDKRFLTASYAAELAIRDAVNSRSIITSPWYQRLFGDAYRLAGDQNVKSRYKNDKAGHRIAVGVGGGSTGEGGDYLIVDDPHKADEALSDTKRQSVTTWWDNTMSTRGNDPQTVVRIVIMQRLHQSDLTGHILDKAQEGGEQYEHLILPMEYTPKRYISSIGLDDPRENEGDLLWPERFPAAEVAKLKVTLGEMGAAGQLQQRPAPAGGATFQSVWWQGQNRFDFSDPRNWQESVGRWLSFDTALKDKESSDYTGMSVGELSSDYLLKLRRAEWKKLQFPQLASEIRDQAERWNYDGKLSGVIIEDKASGISAIQTLRQEAPDWLSDIILAFNPGSQSKEARARQASLWCERGCVQLPLPANDVQWLYEFEHEHLYKFPASKFDDPEDSFVQLIIYLEHLLAEGWRVRTGV